MSSAAFIPSLGALESPELTPSLQDRFFKMRPRGPVQDRAAEVLPGDRAGVGDPVLLERVAQNLLQRFWLETRTTDPLTNPVRGKIMELQHPRAVVEDVRPRREDSSRSAMDTDYWSLMARSKFVLCPRGVGRGSYRVFETLCAGRVPVIVSDDWQLPDGVDWEAIARGSPVIVIYMGLRHLDAIAARLIAAGRTPGEPVAIVSKATTPDQRVLVSTLAEAAATAAASGIEGPTIIAIGEVVRLRAALDWVGDSGRWPGKG